MLITGIAAITGSLVFSNLAIHLVWNMLNELQLMVHLPLFSPTFPANAFKLYEYIIDIARFDFIDNSMFIPQMFDLDTDEEPYSPEFGNLAYGMRTSLVNQGSVLWIWLFNLLSILISFLAYFFFHGYETFEKHYRMYS